MVRRHNDKQLKQYSLPSESLQLLLTSSQAPPLPRDRVVPRDVGDLAVQRQRVGGARLGHGVAGGQVRGLLLEGQRLLRHPRDVLQLRGLRLLLCADAEQQVFLVRRQLV